ncbi:MAG: DUF4388 domain-containing protein [Methyloprofundus sp.]|nr:DUF4388 domain-containing protein [Methyloprofundus sp.]
MKKKTLIVLHDPLLLTSFKLSLHNRALSDDIILVANNSAALKKLKNNTIDVLLTDLEPAEFDAFDLLIYAAKNHPDIQITVLSDLAATKNKTPSSIYCAPSLKSVHDLDLLIQEDNNPYQGGVAANMLVYDLFNLIALAKRTCLLSIECMQTKAAIYFYQGELFDTFCKHSQGEQLIFQVLDKKCLEVSFRPLPDKKFRQNISTPLTELYDRYATFQKQQPNIGKQSKKTFTIQLLKEKVQQLKAVDKPVKTSDDKDFGSMEDTKETQVNKTNTGKKIMASLEDSLKPLQEVDGYLASAIFDMSGEVLAQHNNSKYDVSLIGANAVAMINSAVKAVSGAGLGKCNFIQVNSEKGIFGAVWAVEDQSVAAVLLEANANVGMAKIMLAKVGDLSGSHLA